MKTGSLGKMEYFVKYMGVLSDIVVAHRMNGALVLLIKWMQYIPSSLSVSKVSYFPNYIYSGKIKYQNAHISNIIEQFHSF